MDLNINFNQKIELLNSAQTSVDNLNIKFLKDLPKGFSVGKIYEVSLVKEFSKDLAKLFTNDGVKELPLNLIPEGFKEGEILITAKNGKLILNFKPLIKDSKLNKEISDLVKKTLVSKLEISDVLNLVSKKANSNLIKFENFPILQNEFKVSNNLKELLTKIINNNSNSFKEIINKEIKSIDLKTPSNEIFNKLIKNINSKSSAFNQSINSYEKISNLLNEITSDNKYTPVSIKEKLSYLLNTQKEKLNKFIKTDKVQINSSNYEIEKLFDNQERVSQKTLDSLVSLLEKTLNNKSVKLVDNKLEVKKITSEIELILNKESLNSNIKKSISDKFNNLLNTKNFDSIISKNANESAELANIESEYKTLSSKIDFKEVVKKVFIDSQNDINNVNKRTNQNEVINQLKNLEQLVHGQEIFEKLNPLLKATDQPIFILFPSLIRNYLSTLEVSYLQRTTIKFEKDSKNKKRRKYNVLKLKVDFPKLGEVIVNLKYDEKELYVEFFIANEKHINFIKGKLFLLNQILAKSSKRKIFLSVKQERISSILPDAVKDLLTKEVQA